MPSYSDHLTRARHNRQFVDFFDLETTPFLDWVVVGTFYVAVQYADAFLHVAAGLHPQFHSERNHGLQRYIPEIWNDYHFLKVKSEDARYGCVLFGSSEVHALIREQLDQVISRITNELQRRGVIT